MASSWTARDIPDQTGRTVVVTGANSGIGLVTARELARAGAHVIMGCRDEKKGADAAAEIEINIGTDGKGGSAEVRRLDLADLGSVREFAEGTRGTVDVLINNAGLMAIPEQRTADGFEMQIGTNFLGHFALTGRLLDQITDRVVTLSSLAHRMGSVDVSDLNWERRTYRRWWAYGQAKLADLMFAYELEHQFVGAGSRRRSMAAHPGYTATNLQSRTETVADSVMGVLNKAVAQTPDMGALPTLYAATVPDLPGGSYIGPDGWGEATGHPIPVGSSAASHDRAAQRRLWDRAVELTGVTPDVRGR